MRTPSVSASFWDLAQTFIATRLALQPDKVTLAFVVSKHVNPEFSSAWAVRRLAEVYLSACKILRVF